MSCYTRHLKEPMAAAGLSDDRQGRREADRRLRVGLGLPDAHCPEVWRRVKALDADDLLDLLRQDVLGK